MSSIKAFIYKKRYTFIIFGFMCILWVLGRGYIAGDIENADIYLPIYFLDIKAGFVSRTFIGTMLGILTNNNITLGSIRKLIFLNEAVCVMAFSTLAGSIVENFRSKAASFFISFAVVSYGSVRFFLTELWPSVFDHIMVTCMLLCLLCMKRKYTKILIPVLCFVGMWINYGFALCLFPVIMIVLYYSMVYGKNRKWNTFIFGFTALSGFSAAAYFVFFANRYLKMDINALHEYIENRMGELPCSFHGIDAYLFGTLGDKKDGSGFLDILLHDYEGLKEEGFSLIMSENAVIFGLVIMMCFAAFWVYILKKNNDAKIRFAAFFNICLLPVSVISCTASGDNSRFMAFGIIANIVSICAAIYMKLPCIEDAWEKIYTFLSGKIRFAPFIYICIIVYSEYFRNAGWRILLCSVLFSVSLILLVKGKEYFSCAISSVASVFFADYLICFAAPLFILTFFDGTFRKDTKSQSRTMLASSVELVIFAISVVYRLATVRLMIGFMPVSSIKAARVLSAVGVVLFEALTIVILKKAGRNKSDMILTGVLASVSFVVCFLQLSGLTGSFYNVSAAWLIGVSAYYCFAEHKQLEKLQGLLGKSEEKEPFLFYCVPALIFSAVI